MRFWDRSDVFARAAECGFAEATFPKHPIKKERSVCIVSHEPSHVASNCSSPSLYCDFWQREIATKSLTNTHILRVDSVEGMCTGDSARQSFLISMHAPHSLSLCAGETVSVHPPNEKATVAEILSRWKMTGYEKISVDSSEYFLADYLTFSVDLRAIPKKPFLKWLADRCTSHSSEDRLVLSFLASSAGASLYSQMAENHLGLSFFLCEFAVEGVSLLEVLEFVPAMPPRHYSPCGWSAAGLALSFCFTLEENGLCSSWMRSLAGGDSSQRFICISTGVRVLQPFRFSEVPRLPLIFVATGAGIAPFVGILDYLLHLHATGLSNSFEVFLFYGCRHPEKDFLFRNILEKLPSTTLKGFFVAFSRYSSPNAAACYVQDRLFENASFLCHLVAERNASIYVCGNASKMVKSVKEAFDKIFSENAPFVCVSQMQKEKRYMMEIW